MNCDLHNSIPDWIIEHPETSEVFGGLGFDISCAGKSLEYVCRHQGFSPADVLDKLREAIACEPRPSDSRAGGEFPVPSRRGAESPDR